MNDTTREVGAATGITVIGSVDVSHHRSLLPEYVDQLPAESAESVRRSAAADLHAPLIGVSVVVVAAVIGVLPRAPKTPPATD
ncbi:hypothetical protein ABK046_21385 [Streptomyces caeruleatus]